MQYNKTHHDVEGVDTCHIHGRKEDDKVGHHAAESTEQRGSGPITLRGIAGPVNVAAPVHLITQWKCTAHKQSHKRGKEPINGTRTRVFFTHSHTYSLMEAHAPDPVPLKSQQPNYLYFSRHRNENTCARAYDTPEVGMIERFSSRSCQNPKQTPRSLVWKPQKKVGNR